MIQSMTGYGKSILELPSKKITIEIKSLNSKNLDLNARVPSTYREKEMELRNIIAKSLARGKVDFNLYVEVSGEATTTVINEEVVKDYIWQLKNIVDGDATALLSMAVRMPDALKTEREELDEEEYQKIIQGVNDALDAINLYRTDEGAALETDFRKRVKNIQVLLEEVTKIDPERIVNVREKLQKAVADLKVDVDENRFEQELMYYLEKYDITEEKVRLNNHLDYFMEALDSKDSNGKKLGFITQEIGREINTIGSKANYAPMQQMVVQMKDELEKIKEQSLNVL